MVYSAIERADLVKRRLRAHRQRLGLAGTPIALSSETIDLTHPDAFKKVIDTVRTAKAILGADIGLVIIDTFAKLIAAAGGDENSAKDQGAVFANVQRVKNNTGVHVALIGHTGKDESRGARGSNALLGDVDVMVTIGGDEIKAVRSPRPTMRRKATSSRSSPMCSILGRMKMEIPAPSTSSAVRKYLAVRRRHRKSQS